MSELILPTPAEIARHFTKFDPEHQLTQAQRPWWHLRQRAQAQINVGPLLLGLGLTIATLALGGALANSWLSQEESVSPFAPAFKNHLIPLQQRLPSLLMNLLLSTI